MSKYIVVIICTLVGLTVTSSWINIPSKITSYQQQNEEESQKYIAFDVLNEKCNKCHKVRNPSKVFTLENMNEYAVKINEQVFVLKRMPKGRRTKLDSIEYGALTDWLNTLGIQNE